MASQVRDGDEFGTLPKVAAYLFIEAHELRAAVKRGELSWHPAATPGGWPRLCVEEVRAWMERRA